MEAVKCPECGNPDVELYPEGLNESMEARGDKCCRCYKCGVKFNVYAIDANPLRPEVLAFAQAIEKAMRNNDPRKGDSWKECSLYHLMAKLEEEVEEVDSDFETAIHAFEIECKPDLLGELVDVGAVAMMPWNRVKDD